MHPLTLKRHNSFQSSFESHTQFCSQTSDFQVTTRSFKIQCYLRESELPKSWSGDKFFQPRKSKFWELLISNLQIFSIPLLNNLLISFLNLFISLIELKTFLNNLFISFLYLFIYLIGWKNIYYKNTGKITYSMS